MSQNNKKSNELLQNLKDWPGNREFAESLKAGDYCFVRFATGLLYARVEGRREFDGLRVIDIYAREDGAVRMMLEDKWGQFYPEDNPDAFAHGNRLAKHLLVSLASMIS